MIDAGRNIIRSTLWNESPRKITKEGMYKPMVQSVVTYGAGTWEVSRMNGNKVLATEMEGAAAEQD
jgi:hypothetical protein